MKKFTKIGLSAVAAFALMFTTTISVVAQEKATASNDNVELKESVEAKVLTGTSQNANSGVNHKKVAMTSSWFPFDVTSPTQPTQPENQLVNGAPSSATPTGDCAIPNLGELCSVHLEYDENDAEVQALLEQIQQEIEDEEEITVTIDDLIAAGASYTNPSNPEYARKL